MKYCFLDIEIGEYFKDAETGQIFHKVSEVASIDSYDEEYLMLNWVEKLYILCEGW